MATQISEKEIFPEEHCRTCFSELGYWTSLEHILAAARLIENRPLATDGPSEKLLVPLVDSDLFEFVAVKCLELLIVSYRVPSVKISLARILDPEITEQTVEKLRGLRWKPTIRNVKKGSLMQTAPDLAIEDCQRCFLIEDSVESIELIQNPVRCLIDMMSRTWQIVPHLQSLEDVSKPKVVRPNIFHQPYTDGPLIALVEAMFFYSCGLTIGPVGSRSNSAINLGFRCVDVIAKPPVDTRLIDVAHKALESMFEQLR
ncbi:MAG: hypothetical protein JWO13_2643 [Acidobacteriales bacterium]|nr:hypothetical protein [Terriglobales bacterium]